MSTMQPPVPPSAKTQAPLHLSGGRNLPAPKDKQIEVLYLDAMGHVVVLGAAGSGKSTIAVLRAVYLADPRAEHAGRTLLLTFNRSLATYLVWMAGADRNQVVVENYHRWARGYLNARGLMRTRDICDYQRDGLIATAITDVAANTDDAVLKRPVSLFREELAWIAQQGIRTLEQYVVAERVGRGDARLTRRQRPIVYEVYKRYLSRRAEAGFRYDWDDLPQAVMAALANDATERRYKHIVVDEMQNFTPTMLQSLVLAVPEGGSLTLFGDSAQQIYGRRISWKSAGIKVRQPWLFQHNYRNSGPIARLARAVSGMEYFREVEDLVDPVPPTAEGPKPTVVRCSSDAIEVQLVVDYAKRVASTRSVAILLPDRGQNARTFERQLGRHTRLRRDMPAWGGGPGIYFGTYHAAQGLEFDIVILPQLSSQHMPDPADVEVFGEADALANDGRLFYVGVTRARQELLMTYTGEPSPLLPPDEGLYSFQQR